MTQSRRPPHAGLAHIPCRNQRGRAKPACRAEPARPRIAIEAGAEQPEAQPGCVLDAEIVARGPPCSLHQAPSMRSGPSAATTSCSARRQRKRTGGPSGTSATTSSIGSGLASSRSGRGAPVRPRRGSGGTRPSRARLRVGRLRRHGRGGELGDVAVMRDEPRHAPPAEPRAQPVDQAVELGLILAAAETDLLLRARLGDEHREPRQIEAEARIDLVAERGEPLDEQRADRLRIAHRPRRAGGDALDRAVGAEQRKLDAARAVAARRRAPSSAAPPAARRSRARPPRARSARESSSRRDRARPAGAGRAARRSRPSARSSWRRRSAPKRAASGARGRSRMSPMRLRPRRASAATVSPAAAARRAATARARRALLPAAMIAASPKRAAAQAAPMVAAMAARAEKPKPRHARQQIVAQLLLAAEQMRAAADVEQDAVGRIGGDERRVALAPVGDGVEQARVGGLVLRHGGERGMHGARLRQRQARRAGRAAPPRHRPRSAGRDCRACRRRRARERQLVDLRATAARSRSAVGSRGLASRSQVETARAIALEATLDTARTVDRSSCGCSRHCRRMRSVESRAQPQAEDCRRETITLLRTIPLHDPGAEMSPAVAHQPRGEPRRTDAVRRRRCGRRADDPARRGGGRRPRPARCAGAGRACRRPRPRARAAASPP